MNDIREALKADIIEGIEVGLEDGLSPKEIASNIALMLECQDALTAPNGQASHPDREALADELHAFCAAAPHDYPGHNIRLFERAEKALRNDLNTLSVPAGWKLVPIKANRDMTMDACDILPSVEGVSGHAGAFCAAVYERMVENAPTPHRETAPTGLREGDILHYELDEETRIGKITRHERPSDPAPDSDAQRRRVLPEAWRWRMADWPADKWVLTLKPKAYRVGIEMEPLYTQPVSDADERRDVLALADKLMELRSALDPSKHSFVWNRMTEIACELRSDASLPVPDRAAPAAVAVEREVVKQRIRDLVFGTGNKAGTIGQEIDAISSLYAPIVQARQLDADKIGLCASNDACYRWPDDTPEHRLARQAFVEGAQAIARLVTGESGEEKV